MANSKLLLVYAIALVAANKKPKQKSGLRGYELVDSADQWWGEQEPDVGSPRRVLDHLGDRDGKVTHKDWEKIGLPADHFDYFDKNSNGVLDQHEASIWWQTRRFSRTMNLSEVSNPPKGHLQKLGAWKDPLPSSDLEYHKPYPHPREFWHKHMDGFLPANLKCAQCGWPAMNWTREVLTDRFGWVDAKLEPKIEGRNNNTAFKELDAIAPGHRINVSEYLRVEAGKNMYVVSILPQAMAYEVAHPAVLLCGSRQKLLDKESKPPYKTTKHLYPHESNYSWMTHLFEANLWIATGRTRSQFHYDKEWNVNCLLSGRKRWFFINPFWYDKDLNWARGEKFKSDDPLNNAWTDWVYLDPDAVDLIVLAKMRNMDYYELIQEPGDCIFIPYAMLHQVEKLDDGLQTAASWMFLPETIYDEEACTEAPLEKDLPLSAMDTMYAYSGKGVIPQGYGDPLFFVRDLRRTMKSKGEKVLSEQTLSSRMVRGSSIIKSMPKRVRQQKVKDILKLLTKYAKNPEEGLHVDELNRVPLRIWAKPTCEGDQEGPLPCDHGQEYQVQDDDEFAKMRARVEQELAAEPKKTKAKPANIPGISMHQRSWPVGRRQHTAGGREEL